MAHTDAVRIANLVHWELAWYPPSSGGSCLSPGRPPDRLALAQGTAARQQRNSVPFGDSIPFGDCRRNDHSDSQRTANLL